LRQGASPLAPIDMADDDTSVEQQINEEVRDGGSASPSAHCGSREHATSQPAATQSTPSSKAELMLSARAAAATPLHQNPAR